MADNVGEGRWTRINGEIAAPQPDPERQAYAQELGRVLEAAVDALPDAYARCSCCATSRD